MTAGKCVRLLSLTVALLFLGSATALAFGTDYVAEEEVAVKVARETVKGGYSLVTVDELKKWVDEKKPMLIVDTMPLEDSYKKQHVPGAVQFEFPKEELNALTDEMNAGFEKLLGPDKNRTLVFYCGFPKCARSHNGAMWAKKMGYANVIRFTGGIMAWDQKDFPIEKANASN
jgi:rhodanese-related sulfurtransferase